MFPLAIAPDLPRALNGGGPRLLSLYNRLELSQMNRMTAKSDAAPSSADARVDLSPSKPGGKRIVRVLLADDHPVVRWGLSCCLAPHEHLVVIGEAADGLEALRKSKELCPDVVLMDVDMPQLNGLAATEILHREHPEVKVLLFSMHSYKGHLSRILQSGARGFVLKDIKPSELVGAITRIAAGETCFSPDAAHHALSHFAHNRGGNSRSVLTAREREVLSGIADGLSNKQLAARLGISARTIETHRNHIMHKLNIHTIAGLTRFAVAEGLVVFPQDNSGS